MSRWVRYVLHTRVWTETSRSETVLHIGSYRCSQKALQNSFQVVGGHHLQVQKVFPPRASCTLELVGGIVDLVTICNMSNPDLSLDAAEPVISIKGLGGVAEVTQRHHLITLLGGVLRNELQQLMG